MLLASGPSSHAMPPTSGFSSDNRTKSAPAVPPPQEKPGSRSEDEQRLAAGVRLVGQRDAAGVRPVEPRHAADVRLLLG